MKRFKIVFAALAILFAVGSSFTTKNNSNVDEYFWFQYDEENDMTDRDSYFETTSAPSCASSSGIVCKIFVRKDPSVTTHIAALQSDLDAFVNADAQLDNPQTIGSTLLKVRQQ